MKIDYSIPECSANDMHLNKIMSRYHSFDKPKNMRQAAIINKIQALCTKEIIWDWGCGTGVSSIKLAEIFPDKQIIGIDQSIHRLQKNPYFTDEVSQHGNLILARANIIDVVLQWTGNTAKQQYWLHPNPWPLKKHMKRRWPLHPIFQKAISMAEYSIMRTNWQSYAMQWQYSCNFFAVQNKYDLYTGAAMSAFEKKYQHNLQKIYQVVCWL